MYSKSVTYDIKYPLGITGAAIITMVIMKFLQWWWWLDGWVASIVDWNYDCCKFASHCFFPAQRKEQHEGANP